MLKLIRYLFKKLLQFGFVLVLTSLLLVVSLAYVNPPVWMWKFHRMISPPEDYPQLVYHQWVPMAQVAESMQLAVIAAEDQRFAKHRGFDFDAISQAIQSKQQGKRLRGASTISQQTAKNLFLWPARSFLRKGIEAWFTVLMEFLLTKQRILELYLNIVEFGPGIFGVEAASQHYFSKSAQALTPGESARLAAVLPNPYRFQVDNASDYTLKRVRWIEQQMRQLGHVALKN